MFQRLTRATDFNQSHTHTHSLSLKTFTYTKRLHYHINRNHRFTMQTPSTLIKPLSPPLRLKPNHPHKNFPVSAQLVRRNSGVQASLRVISAQLPTTKTDYSISDADLESRGFHLRRTPEGLNLTHLNSVFVSVGFPKRDPDKIRTALDHTDSLLWVEYEKTKRPVAFARATGDGVFNAIIWDVVVDPSFQGIGLGKAVMERVVNELLGKGIRNIALYSEPRVLGFYRPLGFVADPDGITGMVYSRKQKKKKKK